MSNKEIEQVDFLLDKINKENLSDNVERKFVETIDLDNWQVLSDNGYVDILSIGKTVPYEKWRVKTENGYILECADTHIVFDSEYDEIFVKDLNKDSRPDFIITDKGPSRVISVENLGILENMYDLNLSNNSEHRYFTSGILSHNSIWLANDAANFVRMGSNVVFVTAEMANYKVVKRIGSNLLSIPMNEYDRKSKDKSFIQRKLERVGSGVLPPGNLFIHEVPTSQASVLDIESYLLNLEEVMGIKINVVVIDYINILMNYRNPHTENTYMKIKQIAEDLRGMASKNNFLVISATQITRSGWDSTDLKMENIAESAGLSHTADMIYGIIQDQVMHSNYEYWLKMLKIRDGEGKGTKCKFEIDYNFMRLTETSEIIQVSDM